MGDGNRLIKTDKKTVLLALRDSLPIMAGYIVLGIGFGILLQSKGFAWYWAFIMSACVFAGSMQYLAVDLLASGASMLVFAIMTLVVNARHLFYGIAMLVKYRDVGKAKPFLMFWLTDETFSIVCSAEPPKDVNRTSYYFFVSMFDYLYWVIGSTIGALFATFISFNSAGVEFSMTALFVITLLNQWEKSENHLPAITGLAVTLVCLIIFGSENFLIPAMALITLLLLLERRVISHAE